MTDLPQLTRPGSPGPRHGVWAALRSGWVRLLHRHRPLLVALLAGLAVLAVVDRVTAAGDTVTVLAATRDLPLGEPLSPGLVHPVEVPTGLAPARALTRLPRGSRLTGPVRSGEVLTDLRVSESGLPPVPAGSVAVPVPLAADASRWLRPGQEILLFPSAGTDPLTEAHDGPRPVRATILASPDKPDEILVGSGVKVVTFLVTVKQGEAPSLVSQSDTSSLVPVLVS